MRKNKKEKEDKGFFSDSFSILFNPHKFVFDFKQSTPKVVKSGNDKGTESVIWHKPVLMDPVLAKKLVHVLEKNVEKYEDKYGEIEIKEKSEEEVEAEEPDTEEPSYIG
ncbi:MAG: DUF3467 domain-containing protein [Candidatus Aenigmatarchaeota archaeon]